MSSPPSIEATRAELREITQILEDLQAANRGSGDNQARRAALIEAHTFYIRKLEQEYSSYASAARGTEEREQWNTIQTEGKSRRSDLEQLNLGNLTPDQQRKLEQDTLEMISLFSEIQSELDTYIRAHSGGRRRRSKPTKKTRRRGRGKRASRGTRSA